LILLIIGSLGVIRAMEQTTPRRFLRKLIIINKNVILIIYNYYMIWLKYPCDLLQASTKPVTGSWFDGDCGKEGLAQVN
jgi:hypothetical protein